MKAISSLIRIFGVALIVVLLARTSAGAQQSSPPPNQPPVWAANLDDIRRTAALVPGRRPLRINVVKFAESPRSRKFAVQGAADQPSVQARTAYQVVYADGTVMIDAGMDEQVHKFFGRGAVEPYDSAAAKEVEGALRRARMIVVTHEHGDHVAGVIHTPLANELAPKTVLTKTQVQTLLTNPQMPEIKLTPEMASRYVVVDYEKYAPLASGMALVKAPGHTPGSQMIYVALESGQEYLFAGDTAWLMEGILTMRGKDAPWLVEDTKPVMAELAWLNGLTKTSPNLHIVVSHDDEQRKQYIAAGTLGDKFE